MTIGASAKPSSFRGDVIPQGRVIFHVSTAPHRPITPRRLLRLVYTGPPIIKTAAEIIAIVRERTADILTEAELALVIRLPALPAPEPIKAKTRSKRRKAAPAPRTRGPDGRFRA